MNPYVYENLPHLLLEETQNLIASCCWRGNLDKMNKKTQLLRSIFFAVIVQSNEYFKNGEFSRCSLNRKELFYCFRRNEFHCARERAAVYAITAREVNLNMFL